MTTLAALRMGARSFSHSSPYSVEFSLHEAGAAGLRPLERGPSIGQGWGGCGDRGAHNQSVGVYPSCLMNASPQRGP